MVPGKHYKPEDYLEILWRRKWFLGIPLVVALAGTAAYSRSLPNRYRSEARIQIVPQQVPTNFVRSTVTASLNERLQAISAQILSRSRLEQILQEFDLYPVERRTMIMEDVIAQMRVDVNVGVGSGRSRGQAPGSFTVGYVSSNPRTAMLVAERLASLFIKENLQNREVLADATDQFVQSQLEDARRRLIEHEQKLQEYRKTHAGELPTQLAANLQLMENSRRQVQDLVDSINRDRDRQLVLDRMTADTLALSASQAGVSTTKPTQDEAQPVIQGSAAQQLDAARAALERLKLRLTPEHPDIIRAHRIISDLERKAEAEAMNVPVSSDGPAASVPQALPLAEQKRLATMQVERETLERRIGVSAKEKARLEKVIAAYQARIEATPARESELIELTRGYGTVQGTYEGLLRKSEQSRIAVDLERRQIGEQFRILESARLPVRPTSPDRFRLNAMGAAAGLGVGLLFVLLLEYRDSALRTDDDVAAALGLPVLALVPTMVTAQEKLTRRRRRLLAAACGALAMLACAGVLVWKLNILERWTS